MGGRRRMVREEYREDGVAEVAVDITNVLGLNFERHFPTAGSLFSPLPREMTRRICCGGGRGLPDPRGNMHTYIYRYILKELACCCR